MIDIFVGLIFGIMLIDMLIFSEIKTALIKINHTLFDISERLRIAQKADGGAKMDGGAIGDPMEDDLR